MWQDLGQRPQVVLRRVFLPSRSFFDYTAIKKKVRREDIASRSFNMWRYSEFLPLSEGFTPPNAVGGTPLVAAKKTREAPWCPRSLRKE